MADETDHFRRSLDNLEGQLTAAVSVSEAAIGRLVGWQGIWASILHARVIMNAGSMLKVIEAGRNAPLGAQLLDHFSVASIARTAMEAGLMMLYVSDDTVDDDEFEMRRTVFRLQDTCHRTRMFKDGESIDPAIKATRDMYRLEIEKLRGELNAMPAFLVLTEEHRSRILEGRDFYVGGVRGALKRTGWDKGEYETWESYFSGYVHSMPMSFLRAEEHGIDFASISTFQYDLCGTAMMVAADTLERTTGRMSHMLSKAPSE